jgi:hypothetical protein
MNYTQIGLIVVLVIALCEALKRAGFPNRFIPLLAVGLSIVGAFIFDGVNFLATSAGIILGLGSSGLYDVVKKSILNK